jgi:hypothetical protein
VLAPGPSEHEQGTYFLVRAYAGLSDLEAQQNAYYDSSRWGDGPPKAIVSRIEGHLSTIL